MFELGMLLIISLYSPLSVELIRFLFAEYVQLVLTYYYCAYFEVVRSSLYYS